MPPRDLSMAARLDPLATPRVVLSHLWLVLSRDRSRLHLAGESDRFDRDGLAAVVVRGRDEPTGFGGRRAFSVPAEAAKGRKTALRARSRC